VRLEVWSPLPPAPTGVADHVAEMLVHRPGGLEVAVVTEDPARADASALAGARLLSPSESDDHALRLYELGNSRFHGFVYRAALRRPGVLRLHEWNLHDLVLWETHHQGCDSEYERLMRVSYGDSGARLARQVLLGRGTPVVQSVYPLCEHLVACSLGVAATTAFTRQRAQAVRPGLPAAHVPLHAVAPSGELPSREQARAALGLPLQEFVVTAPGVVNPLKGLDVAIRCAGRLRRRGVPVRLVVAGANAPGLPLASWARDAGLEDAFTLTGRLTLDAFALHLAAADAVLALRFPSFGEMSAVLLRAMARGRPALVTAGTPAHAEFPEGVVIPVDPGRYQLAELEEQLALLHHDPRLARQVGRAARSHVLEHHDPVRLAERLFGFLGSLASA
jgi:glycosyltransferase involved in cell wall biosynthesis